MVTPKRLCVYRAGEVIFLLLIIFYFSGGLSLLPTSWLAVLDATPKIYRKLFAWVAGAVVKPGLALLEWARRDRKIGTCFSYALKLT